MVVLSDLVSLSRKRQIDEADRKAAELLAAEIGQPIDRQVTVYYDLFRTVHW